MAKFDFLDILEEELEKNFTYDFEMNWDKKNFAVEVSFLLEAANPDGVDLVDDDGVETADNILYEDAVLFYNPKKSRVRADEYLATIPYSDKGLSREFLAYFAQFLQETADKGLDDLMDFLSDETAEKFSVQWDGESFEQGLSVLRREASETEFYKYPRY